MITELGQQFSIMCDWIREIRDVSVQDDRMRFRRNIERIGEIAAFEISKHLVYEEVTVQTPMGEATCFQLEQQPVLATILRAGIPLHHGLLNYFDKADNAFIAAYRKHHRDGSFEIEQQYITSAELEGRPLIVADPMLASGSSVVLALETMTETEKPSQIHVVSVIACTVGIEMVKRKFPEAYIWAGAIDEELTARGYIVPGLGDAGDLAYGTKMQA
ncbi:uracil phosphoribosyltransferase [Polluticoccus soli]|uniref:uracil phosphoribosyltransferase n=1 Tax=Polluticoccus soli TaxID=3034150 RepID=UPI0023E19A2A|nr:uracil phosphoribosyltransferase [Flavipsychrobacter sp. JY13-12]